MVVPPIAAQVSAKRVAARECGRVDRCGRAAARRRGRSATCWKSCRLVRSMTSCFMSNDPWGRRLQPFVTVTFRKVAGISVRPPPLFWATNSLLSSWASSRSRKSFDAASNAFIVGPVEAPERFEEVGRRTVAPEVPGALLEADVRRSDPGRFEALAHLALVAPGHGADEAFGRRRRIGSADLQDLRDQRRVAGNPVAHDDPAARLRHADQLLRDVERPGSEHRAEDGDDEVVSVAMRMPVEIRRVAFLEAQVGRDPPLSRAPCPQPRG